MIGNDIVDLEVAAAESNWRRKGFLQKLFTIEEQEILNASPEPDIFLWLLWSMKESAYKAHQRKLNLSRKFNPKDFLCKIKNVKGTSASGVVTIDGHKYHTKSSVEGSFVYTYASCEKNLKIKQEILAVSRDIKLELISSFSSTYKLPQEKILIKKNKCSIPYISYENQEIICNLSLTHHGRFSAYIFELINL